MGPYMTSVHGEGNWKRVHLKEAILEQELVC